MVTYKVFLNQELLKDNPIGLDDLQLKIDRNRPFEGLYVETALNLTFVGDGYCKLEEFKLNSSECFLPIIITTKCDRGRDVIVFNGIIPLATISLDLSRKEATGEIEDNNPLALIARNAEVDFDFSSTTDIFGNPLFDSSNPYDPIEIPNEVGNYSAYPDANGIYIKTAIERIVNFMTGIECEMRSDFLLTNSPQKEQWVITFVTNVSTSQDTTIVYKNYYGQVKTVNVVSTGTWVQHMDDIAGALTLPITTVGPADVREIMRNYTNIGPQSVIPTPTTIVIENNVPFEIISVTTSSGVGASVSFDKTFPLIDGAKGIYFFDWPGLHGEVGKLTLTFKKVVEEINKATGCGFFIFLESGKIVIRMEPDSYFLSRPVNKTYPAVRELISEDDFNYDKIKLGSNQDQKSQLNANITYSLPYCGINNSLDVYNDFIFDIVQIWIDIATTFSLDDKNDSIYMIQVEGGQAVKNLSIYTNISGVPSGIINTPNGYLNNDLKILRFMSRIKSEQILGSPDIIITNIAVNKIIRGFNFITNITIGEFKSYVDPIPDMVNFKLSKDTNYRSGIVQSIVYNYTTGEANFKILGS